MKYIEEIEPGQSFFYQDNYFLMTADFKKNGDRLSISLANGTSRWMGASETVDLVVLYTIDEDSNFKHIREEDSNDTNKNI